MYSAGDHDNRYTPGVMSVPRLPCELVNCSRKSYVKIFQACRQDSLAGRCKSAHSHCNKPFDTVIAEKGLERFGHVGNMVFEVLAGMLDLGKHRCLVDEWFGYRRRGHLDDGEA